MNSNTVLLTREDIVETTGIQNLEQLQDLEILFQSIHEIASLEFCPNLRRLSLIDNGLKKISNLQPVALTLTHLCLCDQNLTVIENLNLPNLRELHLHRNKITSISTLSGCPRLRKLRLFQNQLSTVEGLHSLPELEDCWLQENLIVKLNGFEHNQQLINLGLAGNPIQDLKEIKKLSNLSKLREVSFNDIHFGRCPIVDEMGYNEFIMLHLPWIQIIDGVKMSSDRFQASEQTYLDQVKEFNDSLQEIEEDYLRSIRQLDAQHQSRESHANTLEKEMSQALKELQGLVGEGRQVISKQVNRVRSLLQSNTATLIHQVKSLEVKAKEGIADHMEAIKDEFDLSSSWLFTSERTVAAEDKLLLLLCEVIQSDSHLPATTSTHHLGQSSVLFHSISNNTGDFGMISSYVSSISDTFLQSQSPSHPPLNPVTKKSSDESMAPKHRTTIKLPFNRLELIRLFKISAPSLTMRSHPLDPPPFPSVIPPELPMSTSIGRVFFIMSFTNLSNILRHGWWSLRLAPAMASKPNESMQSILCSFHPEVLSALHESHDDYLETVTYNDYQAVIAAMYLNNHNITTAPSNDGNHPSSPNTSFLPHLQTALGMQLFVTISCRLSFVAGLWDPASTASTGQVTLQWRKFKDRKAKAQLLSDLQRSEQPQSILMDYEEEIVPSKKPSVPVLPSSRSSSKLFVIPVHLAEQYLTVDFIGLTASIPSPDGSTSSSSSSKKQGEENQRGSNSGSHGHSLTSHSVTKAIDPRLEMLMMPTLSHDRSGDILNKFQRDCSQEIQSYTERLLEEIDEIQSVQLKSIESDVTKKEISMKQLRDDIERERKHQETYLKDTKTSGDG